MKQSRFRIRGVRVALLCSVLGASPSAAVDGVIEINQAKALVGALTASDTPGFPVTIDATGSYALTGNLTVSGLDTSGIVVTASDVTLDLRGFTIQGGCPAIGCAPDTGAGDGIAASLAGNQVRNGRVRGFASDGVFIGPRARISMMVVEKNGGDGINASGQIDIVDTTAVQNADFGIDAGAQAKIRNSVADSNGQGGITTAGYSIVSESASRSNQLSSGISFGSGIRVGTACLLQGNAVSSNESYGIDVEGRGTLVIDNIVSGNGSAGILLVQPGSVHENASTNNDGIGISLPATGSNRAAYRGNVVNGNSVGSVGGGINIGGNSCNGTGGCP